MTESGLTLWRRLRRRLYWLLAVATVACAKFVPAGAGRWFGARLGRLALRWRGRERTQARKNLEWAFPLLEVRQRDRLLRESVDALGRNLFDGLAAERLLKAGTPVVDQPGSDGRRLTEVIVAEHGQGRGVILLAGHLGCWELFGGWLARELERLGCGPLGVVTARVRNPAVDRLLTTQRRRLGLNLLPREAGAAPLVAHLRHGGVAAVLVDQNTVAGSAMVPFFGRPSPTPTTPARLAVRHDIPVIVTAIARRPHGGGHVVSHGETWRADPARAGTDQVDECLRWTNDQIEANVRRNPSEWVWFHRRWAE